MSGKECARREYQKEAAGLFFIELASSYGLRDHPPPLPIELG